MTFRWPHAMEEEYRDPVFTFTIPSAWLWWRRATDEYGGDDQQFGVYSVSILYWIELIVLMCCQVAVATVMGYILFKLVLEPRRTNTVFAYLLCWGVLVPFWIVFPNWTMKAIGLRNYLFKFGAGSVVGLCSVFRTTEATYGFAPAILLEASKDKKGLASTAARDYSIYFGSVLLFRRSPKTGRMIPVSWTDVGKQLLSFVRAVFVLGAFQSCLALCDDWSIFGSDAVFGLGDDSNWWRMGVFLNWKLYGNNLGYAFMFFLYLHTYSEGLTLFWILVSGYHIEPMMLNPLTESRSVADFWGRRWNMTIHHCLKGGVYKPVRRYFNSTIAGTVASFMASGAFHEWLVYMVFVTRDYQLDENRQCGNCVQPIYGGSMVFMSWQAMLMIGESLLSKTELVASIQSRLSPVMRTTLIVSCGLPMAHLFCEAYIRSSYFLHGQAGLPMILRLP